MTSMTSMTGWDGMGWLGKRRVGNGNGNGRARDMCLANVICGI